MTFFFILTKCFAYPYLTSCQQRTDLICFNLKKTISYICRSYIYSRSYKHTCSVVLIKMIVLQMIIGLISISNFFFLKGFLEKCKKEESYLYYEFEILNGGLGKGAACRVPPVCTGM